MDRINTLFDKYQNNQCKPEEIEELLEYFRIGDEESLLKTHIDLALSIEASDDTELEKATDEVYGRIKSKILRDKPDKGRLILMRWIAAASILLFLSVGAYFILNKQQAQQVAQKQDLVPANDQATLTLANGQKIILTKGLSGKLANQGNTLIQVNAGHAIAYTTSTTGTGDKVEYNTLSTKKGEQSPYPLVLADGTKVWLNAESSITFPTAFNSKERMVKITGEAYFEVVHKPAQAFKVIVRGQVTEDIGTHFNINAYDDEPALKTTLLEGSVKVFIPSSSSSLQKAGVRLNPGQEAVNNNNGLNVQNADTEQAVAWKNGYFQFNHADLYTVMRQLSRWYDVDVAYEGNIPKKIFSGKIHRNLNASESLQMLQYFKVNYKIQGKTIIISN
jgi:transmembrane sensor